MPDLPSARSDSGVSGHLENIVAVYREAEAARDQAADQRDEYAKRLKMAVELLERIEREAHWVGSSELEKAIEDFTDMMREDGWVPR